MPRSSSLGNFRIGSACDAGLQRASNEDALAVFLPEPGVDVPPLLVIADGMGGYLGGETASQLVIDTFHEIYVQLQAPLDAERVLRICVERAHRAICAKASKDQMLKDMGSTVVAAFLGQERLSLINVGDSRAYLLRDGQARQVSQDQSWVMEQVRAGQLSLEQAPTHPRRNQLSMSLTPNRSVVTPIFTEEAWTPADALLLCSDGLWSVISESLLWETINEFPPQKAAEQLVDLANQRGGPDNISVIVVRWKE